MAFDVKVSGVWKASSLVTYKIGSVWTYARKAYVKANNGWHEIFPLFTPYSQSVTATGTVAVPHGASSLFIQATGGGSSGAVSLVNSILNLGASGSGGATGNKTIPIYPQDWGTNLSITVGAGGDAVTNTSGSNIDGNAGGASTVSASLTAGTLNVTANGGISGKGSNSNPQAAATASGVDSSTNGGVPSFSGANVISGGSIYGAGVITTANVFGNGVGGNTSGVGVGGGYGQRGGSGTVTSGVGARGQVELSWS